MISNRKDLGSIVRDKITGIKGVLVARCEWQHGCVRLTMQPMGATSNGEPIAPHTTDEQNVEMVEAIRGASRPSGGPHDTPETYASPKR